MAESAETASRVGTKISVISFISAGQFHSRAASVRFPQKWQKYQEAFCFASYFETSTVSFAA